MINAALITYKSTAKIADNIFHVTFMIGAKEYIFLVDEPDHTVIMTMLDIDEGLAFRYVRKNGRHVSKIPAHYVAIINDTVKIESGSKVNG